jgi:hypothetical protein
LTGSGKIEITISLEMKRGIRNFFRAARIFCAGCGFLAAFAVLETRADDTFVYAVQLSAAVQANPPQILLSWEPDPYGAISYAISRKSAQATSWGPATVVPGSATNYLDTNVVNGSSYEYQVFKAATLGYKGYGYIYAGINAPMIESRGGLSLIVATNSTTSLSNELGRLEADLIGDGWRVTRHDVSSNDTPAAVRSLIISDYSANPSTHQAVFLLGPVPILHSGNVNYDGHFTRAMPADAFYADIDGVWNNPSFLPSDVELMIGRVDFENMPGAGAPVPWPNETELLRNYLNKDHRWRHKLINVQHLALMGNRRGDESGEATAASGYRNFEPLVGPGNTVEADIQDNAPAAERWISKLATGNYLWAYGCGGGQTNSISALGTNGEYFDVWSTDIVAQDAKAVFVMLFGSYFGNWDGADDIMRAVLATPGMGLACCMAGRPHWFFHHMGLGEPIGYSTRLTMNNSTLYQSQSNGYPRAVYISLMGDPTLRLDPVAPISGLTAAPGADGVHLNWSASPDTVLGYHVYRSTNSAGPFARLTTSLLTGTGFIDATGSSGIYTYMIRAVKLQATPSGTYFNASQGIFVTIDSTPIRVLANRTAGALALTWNSQPGRIYHVLTKTNLAQSSWTDLSGPLTASATNTTWTDEDLSSSPRRFYVVAREP